MKPRPRGARSPQLDRQTPADACRAEAQRAADVVSHVSDYVVDVLRGDTPWLDAVRFAQQSARLLEEYAAQLIDAASSAQAQAARLRGMASLSPEAAGRPAEDEAA